MRGSKAALCPKGFLDRWEPTESIPAGGRRACVRVSQGGVVLNKADSETLQPPAPETPEAILIERVRGDEVNQKPTSCSTRV